METIPLNWNSRTEDSKIENDKNLENIEEFIAGIKNKDEFILAFQCYSDGESTEFREKLYRLIGSKKDKHFKWIDMNISFGDHHIIKKYSKNIKVDKPDDVITKIGKISDQQSGIVTIFEPINYTRTLTKNDPRYEFQMRLKEYFLKNECKLLLFGNIAYDIHYFRANSPMSKFVKTKYQIPGYKKEEIPVLSEAKEKIAAYVLDKCGGDFEIVTDLRKFWGTMGLEKLVTDLIERFIEIPIKTKIEEQVVEKLSLLDKFLNDNKEFITDQVSFIPHKEKPSIEMDINSKLFQSYFDRTGVFEGTENKSKQKYVLNPKQVFHQVVKRKKFIVREFEHSEEKSDLLKNGKKFTSILELFQANRKPIFLLGAGTSLSSGAPQHIKLLKYLVYKSDLRRVSDDEIQEEFNRYITEKSATEIRKEMIPHLNKFKPSIGHFYLAQLVEKFKIDTIITTNYDTLVEDALMDFGVRSNKLVKIVASRNGNWHWQKWINKLPDNTLRIFKICGDLLYGKKFALKTRDANKFIRKAVRELRFIIKQRYRNIFIILGHALKEKSIFDLLFEYANEETVIVYVRRSEYKANINGKTYKGLEEVIKAKGIETPAKIIEIVDEYYGLFDNFMELLYTNLNKNKSISNVTLEKK